MRFNGVRALRAATVLILMAMLTALCAPLAGAQTSPPTCSQYYTVRAGDTWNTVAAQTGISAAELRKANAAAVRPNGWLYVGDRLCIPTQARGEGYWYQVKRGDTWNTVAKATGVPVRELWNANAGLLNAKLWLYAGQQIWVPGPKPQAASAATPTPTATATATAQKVRPATATPTATSAAASNAPAADCPAALDDYPDAIIHYLDTPGNALPELRAWLAACHAIADAGGAVQAALQTPRSADIIVALQDPAHLPPDGSGQLLVFNAGPKGYALAHRARSTGSVAIIKAADINADGKPDIAWTDTTCGAHTCFSTLFVDSWTGRGYEDWIAGEPTIASAEYRFEDVTVEGSGQEILVYGGVIQSAGAGPQRAWTETYLSAQGAPYDLDKQQYDASPCLYHMILDANTAFAAWKTEGFEPAVEAYQAAVDDEAAEACGNIKDELATLRDFARFRLLVSQVAAGQTAQAPEVIGQIKTRALATAAKTFYDAYRSSGSVIQACRDVTAYAQNTPAAWQFLSDWGYANPSFTPEDLCPIG
jgi:LysM repeat protein